MRTYDDWNFIQGIYSHSVDPLQVYPKAETFTFHNADEDIIPSLTTTNSISPYGLPYGWSLWTELAFGSIKSSPFFFFFSMRAQTCRKNIRCSEQLAFPLAGLHRRLLRRRCSAMDLVRAAYTSTHAPIKISISSRISTRDLHRKNSSADPAAERACPHASNSRVLFHLSHGLQRPCKPAPCF